MSEILDSSSNFKDMVTTQIKCDPRTVVHESGTIKISVGVFK